MKDIQTCLGWYIFIVYLFISISIWWIINTQAHFNFTREPVFSVFMGVKLRGHSDREHRGVDSSDARGGKHCNVSHPTQTWVLNYCIRRNFPHHNSHLYFKIVWQLSYFLKLLLFWFQIQKRSCRKLCKYKSIWRILLRFVSFSICSICHDSYLISQERVRGSWEDRKYGQSGYLEPWRRK